MTKKLLDSFLVATLSALFCSAPSTAQGVRLKNEVEAAFTTMRFAPQQQYIGAGIGYRFFPISWVGLQVELSKFPQRQDPISTASGGAIFQQNAATLLGHSWDKVGLYFEGGGGVMRSKVFEGAVGVGTPNPQIFYDARYYPEVILGGLVDVPAGRHWDLTFEVRDNLTFIGPYSGILNSTKLPLTGGTVNAPEGRAGVAFRF